MKEPILKIGSLELESPVILAPMCGVCDIPYIKLMRRYDQESLVFHEMFSAVGLLNWGRRKDNAPAFRVPDDVKPLGLQLFGHEPEAMGQAARILADAGAAVVDVNLGCPVPKITKGCDGSALLKDTPLLREILKAMIRYVPDKPVTIKMRLGWDDDHRNYVEVAKIAEDAGVAAITVHGRTRSQMYSGSADWEAIAEVVQAVSIPVIGNGDLYDPLIAVQRLKESGCKGVMFGRGAQGNPWIIPRTAHYFKTGELLPEPSDVERLRVALDHCMLLIEEKGERVGVPECRKHVAWYTKGMHASADLRNRVNQTTTREALVEVIESFIETLSGEPAVA